MKIRNDTNFRHDGVGYTAGDELTVDDKLGFLFCQNGWSTCLDGEQPEQIEAPDNVTLDVQNSTIGHEADNIS